MQTIGSRIAQLRSTQGYTPAQLAARLHIPESTVLSWENGGVTPEMGILPQLCKQLRVSPAQLIDGKVPQTMFPEAVESETMDAEQLSALRRQLFLSSLISLSAAALALLCAIGAHALWQNCLISFVAGCVLSAAGLLGALPFLIPAAKHAKKAVFLRLELLISVFLLVFSALAPLVIAASSDIPLSGIDWFFSGGLYVSITGLFCGASAAVINFSAGWWKPLDPSEPLTKVILRRTVLPILLLLISFSIHLFLYDKDRQSGDLPKGGSELTSWDDFAEYMQHPITPDGKATMTLTKIEPVGDNLCYHFTDADGNEVLVENAVRTVVSEKTGEVLCTYLHLNRFVYKIVYSDSDSKLPVTIYTNDNYSAVDGRTAAIHTSFAVIYLLAILLFIVGCRRQKLLQDAFTNTSA